MLVRRRFYRGGGLTLGRICPGEKLFLTSQDNCQSLVFQTGSASGLRLAEVGGCRVFANWAWRTSRNLAERAFRDVRVEVRAVSLEENLLNARGWAVRN